MLDITPHTLSLLIEDNPDAVIIDVRFGYERDEAGFIIHSHHIPLYTPDWESNPTFIEEVTSISKKESPVIVICRNGNRSCDACEILEQYGYEHVYNLQQGYVGLIGLISPNNQGESCSLLGIPSQPYNFPA